MAGCGAKVTVNFTEVPTKNSVNILSLAGAVKAA